MKKTNIAKRFFATVFALLLIAGFVPITAAAADPYDGQPGQGEYTISDEAGLQALATAVNGGANYYQSTFTLTADITLSGEWTPIGTQANPFRGTFDGGGHAISNLTYNNASGDYVGLFGFAGSSESHRAFINNVNLTGVNITAQDYVGGICGTSTYTEFRHCRVAGAVSGNTNVGGLCGCFYDYVSANNCYVTAAVSSIGGTAGGLIGNMENYAYVYYCYAAGSIDAGANTRVGGIAGYTDPKTQIRNSVALQESITCAGVDSEEVGRVSGGFAGNYANVYALSTMTGITFTNESAFNTTFGKNGADMTPAQALSPSTFADTLGWTAYDAVSEPYGWELEGGKLPYIHGYGEAAADYLTTNLDAVLAGRIDAAESLRDSVEISASGDGSDIYSIYQWVTQGDYNTYNAAIATAQGVGTATQGDIDTLDLATSNFQAAIHPEGQVYDVAVILDAWYTTRFDSAEDALEIRTEQNLVDLAEFVNGATNRTFAGKFIKLTADLDLASVCGTGDSWVPIGNTATYHFDGTFDGQGHTISNLYYYSTDTTSTEYGGLFGYVKAGTGSSIYNLALTNVSVTSASNSLGSIAGHIEGTTTDDALISNCSVSGSVVSTGAADKVGGIAGDVSHATFENCSFSGTIGSTYASSSKHYVGGIAGYLNAATSGTAYSSVNSCSVSGTVTAVATNTGANNSYVGGITGYLGYNNEVNNCLSTADISVNNTNNKKVYAGGIVGYVYTSLTSTCTAAYINNCLTVGSLSATSTSGTVNVGGIAGQNGGSSGSTAEINNCFALQSSVASTGAATTNIGRVAGACGSATIANSYAWQDMVVEIDSSPVTPGDDAASLDGADISAADALTGSTYSALSWDGGIWTLTDNDKLPYITAFGPVDTALYTYLTAANNDATLSALTYSVDGGAATAVTGFAAGTTTYNVTLPYGTGATAAITMAGTVTDSGASITANAGVTLAAGAGTATVTVQAADGVTTQTYTVNFTTASNNDATLSALTYSVDGGAATAVTGFAAGTTTYNVTLPYGTGATAAITMAGTVTDSGASITANAGVTLAAGAGTATVTVQAADGVTTQTYTVNFTTASNNDATLSALTYSVDGGAATAVTGFAAGTTTYNVTLPYGTGATAAITMAGTVTDSGASITANAGVTLAAGAGTATVTVQAADGVTTQTYTVNFTTASNNDATLSALTYSVDGGAATAVTGFAAGTTTYNVTLPYGTGATAAITMAGTVTDSGASITANAGVTLAAGAGTATVTVQAADGVTTQTYTVNFTTASNNDATLSALTYSVDGGAATAVTGFAAGTTTYNVTLPYGTGATAAITMAGTVTDSGASITANAGVTLAAGAGTATVTVQAADGVTTQTYTVNFTTASNNDATLSALTYSVDGGAATAVTGFASGTTTYNVTLPYGTGATAAITMAGTVTNSGASITANAGVTLAAGAGTATVTVQAADGVTTQTYTVNFTTASNNDATLLALTYSVDGGAATAVTGFAAGTTTYNVTLPYGTGATAAITMAGTVTDSGASITANAGVTLAAGAGTATVTVQAADGVTTQTYTVNFTTASNNDATLSALTYSVDGGAATAVTGFAAGTTTYNVTLPYGTGATAAITMAGTVTDSGASITANAGVTLAAGAGTATVTVQAADGVTTQIYTVNFTTAGPDITAPTLTNTHVSSLSTTGATINYTSDEAGTYYYVVYLETAGAPDAATVKTGTSGSAITGANSFNAAGLTASTTYTAYVVVEDAAGNTSAIADIDFTTTAVPNIGGGGGATTGDGKTTGGATSNTVNPGATASNGTATAQVSGSSLSDTIEYAQENNSGSIVIAPEVTGSASTVSVVVPASSLNEIAAQTNADLVVDTPVGSMNIPNNTLGAIASQAAGGTVSMSLGTVETLTLTPTQQAAVGSDPVYDISITSGGNNISSFGGASLTVTLPYTLQAGEDPAGVSVWYLNDAGELAQMPCTYDAATGTVSFATDHLSYYVVGYDELAAWENPYADVRVLDWYYDAVAFVSANELFTGTGAAAFSPDTAMTRAMLVTVLYRLEGEPAVSGTNGFKDVESGQWYTNAVIWASANGIVSGYGDNLFGTNDFVTREQMAAILYNYAGYKGYDVSASADLTGFADANDISAWAGKALNWANAEGLITGITSTTLSPSGSATRAQVATILMRFVRNIAG